VRRSEWADESWRRIPDGGHCPEQRRLQQPASSSLSLTQLGSCFEHHSHDHRRQHQRLDPAHRPQGASSPLSSSPRPTSTDELASRYRSAAQSSLRSSKAPRTSTLCVPAPALSPSCVPADPLPPLPTLAPRLDSPSCPTSPTCRPTPLPRTSTPSTRCARTRGASTAPPRPSSSPSPWLTLAVPLAGRSSSSRSSSATCTTLRATSASRPTSGCASLSLSLSLAPRRASAALTLALPRSQDRHSVPHPGRPDLLQDTPRIHPPLGRARPVGARRRDEPSRSERLGRDRGDRPRALLHRGRSRCAFTSLFLVERG